MNCRIFDWENFLQLIEITWNLFFSPCWSSCRGASHFCWEELTSNAPSCGFSVLFKSWLFFERQFWKITQKTIFDESETPITKLKIIKKENSFIFKRIFFFKQNRNLRRLNENWFVLDLLRNTAQNSYHFCDSVLIKNAEYHKIKVWFLFYDSLSVIEEKEHLKNLNATLENYNFSILPDWSTTRESLQFLVVPGILTMFPSPMISWLIPKL